MVESDNVFVAPDNVSNWALGDPCISVVLRFTESGWLTDTRVAMENLRNLTAKQLNELEAEAKG